MVSITNRIRELYFRFKYPRPIISTEEDEKVCNASTICHICGKGEFEEYKEGDDNKRIKVWDHCRLTGKFRGAAHKDCNLNYKVLPGSAS